MIFDNAYKCLSGVLGVQPLGEWGVPKSEIEGRGKAFPLMIFTLLSLHLLADVTCAWNGNNYECDGEGNRVIVSGGGVIQLPPVVTNIVGVCTNCSAISPADLRQLADEIEGRAYSISYQICEGLKDSITSQISLNSQMLHEISTYQTFSWGASEANSATNYMHTANNGQSAGMLYSYNQFLSYQPTAANNTKNRAAVNAGNGIYYYANNYIKPQLEQTNTQLDLDYEQVENIQRSCNIIMDPLCAQLRAGAVECESSWDGSGGGEGGGSTTNTATGNWCTYEQGEALKKLLGAISNEVIKVRANTTAISNFTEQCAYNIRTGLFTDYNAIPSQSQLGDSWQNVYLDGNETNWGYQPTNILARIELLLYGMSGVGTNDSMYTEGETESTEVLDNIDNTTNDAKEQIEALSTDADATSAESLGEALISFFGEFSLSGQQYSEGTELWPASYFRVGQDEYEIPQLTPGRGSQFLNQMQSFSRVFFTVGYWVFGAFLVFRFWAWFAEKAVTMSKWAVELLTSLFAS